MKNDKKAIQTFDDILVEHVGGFGSWQLIIFILLSIPGTFKSSESLIQTLAGFSPPHRCYIPKCDNSSSRESTYSAQWWTNHQRHFNSGPCKVHSGQNGEILSYCNLNDTTALKDSELIECTEWVYDRSIFDETLTTEFNLVCGQNTLVSFLGTIYMVGLLLGSLFGGYFNDTFGRKKTYIVGMSLASACYFGGSFAPNYLTYSVLRLASVTLGFLASFGVYALMLEIVSTKFRRRVGLFRDFSFMLGNVLVGAFGYFIRDWRFQQIACSAPMLLLPLLWFFIPDSVSWLVTQNRLEEAVVIVENAAKKNGKMLTHDQATFLVNSLSDSIKTEESNEDDKTTYKHLFTNKTALKNLSIMTANWIGVNMAWYGLAFNHTMLSGDIFLNFELSALADLPATFAAYYALQRFGRTYTLAGAQILSGLSCLATGFLTYPTWLPHFFYFLGKFFSCIAFNLVYIFTAELFPTRTRATSIGICSGLSRFAGMVTPFVQHLKPIWSPLPYIVLAIPPIAGGILVKFLPETKNIGLPETLKQSRAISEKTAESSLDYRRPSQIYKVHLPS